MANKESLYLCHMTAEEKKAYNAKYYQEHKYDIWGVKSGSDQFSSRLQRPHTYTDTNTGKSYTIGGGRNSDGTGTFDTSIPEWLKDAGFSFGSASVRKRATDAQISKNRLSTPDLDARTASIQKARQQAARLSTPDLNARLKSISAYMQPAKASKLSQITSSAISKGKSIVNGLISLWKSGAKEMKPKTVTTYTSFAAGSPSSTTFVNGKRTK